MANAHPVPSHGGSGSVGRRVPRDVAPAAPYSRRMTLLVLQEPSQAVGRALRIALTGGIGAGKSTVAARLSQLGAVVVSADELARQVVEPETQGFRLLVEAFGDEVVGESGRLDRAKLARLVFADSEALKILERITHPLIEAAKDREFAALVEGQVGVYDVPLLAETGASTQQYDAVIVVEAPLDVRVQRLEQRGLNKEDAAKRIAVQATDVQRRALANFILVNDRGIDELRGSTTLLAEQFLGLEQEEDSAGNRHDSLGR